MINEQENSSFTSAILLQCFLQDIIKKQKAVSSIESLSDAVAIQLNDTHPAISIPELIRILVDEENMPFEKAFDLTQNFPLYQPYHHGRSA